ncbi:MAG TPA: zinc-binding dehydrogenase [Mycobacterium sp.]|nr:zinc-binding dehydrogenase [Mycobacterium sp.]
MRRVRYYEYGGPEVLRIEEVDIPTAGPGQVLMRAEAIGANFIDTKFRQGAVSIAGRGLPGMLTGDVVGTVEAVGPDVDTELIGHRVAALIDGDAFADYVLADAAWLADVPAGLDAASASMLPMAAPVALWTLGAGHFVRGETVLVHAAAGGIGHVAVQLAKLLGAGRVIATAGSPVKLDFAREHGADAAVNYTSDDWPDQVRAAAPDGVDIVLDSVGGQTTHQSLDLLAPSGRVVVYGVASGDYTEVPVASLYRLRSIIGFSLLAWRVAHTKQAHEDMAVLTDHFSAGRLRTTVHARLPLDEAVEAHRILDARAQLGRVLLVP